LLRITLRYSLNAIRSQNLCSFPLNFISTYLKRGTSLKRFKIDQIASCDITSEHLNLVRHDFLLIFISLVKLGNKNAVYVRLAVLKSLPFCGKEFLAYSWIMKLVLMYPKSCITSIWESFLTRIWHFHILAFFNLVFWIFLLTIHLKST